MTHSWSLSKNLAQYISAVSVCVRLCVCVCVRVCVCLSDKKYQQLLIGLMSHTPIRPYFQAQYPIKIHLNSDFISPHPHRPESFQPSSDSLSQGDWEILTLFYKSGPLGTILDGTRTWSPDQAYLALFMSKPHLEPEGEFHAIRPFTWLGLSLWWNTLCLELFSFS